LEKSGGELEAVEVAVGLADAAAGGAAFGESGGGEDGVAVCVGFLIFLVDEVPIGFHDEVRGNGEVFVGAAEPPEGARLVEGEESGELVDGLEVLVGGVEMVAEAWREWDGERVRDGAGDGWGTHETRMWGGVKGLGGWGWSCC
jgi:hypothetical protein